jgi:hypothetical protein
VHAITELFIPVVPEFDTFAIKERDWPVRVNSFALEQLRYFFTQFLKEAPHIRI